MTILISGGLRTRRIRRSGRAKGVRRPTHDREERPMHDTSQPTRAARRIAQKKKAPTRWRGGFHPRGRGAWGEGVAARGPHGNARNGPAFPNRLVMLSRPSRARVFGPVIEFRSRRSGQSRLRCKSRGLGSCRAICPPGRNCRVGVASPGRQNKTETAGLSGFMTH
jgi:hypothetical protein